MAVQAQVLYSGRVQRVGFRASARRLAAGFAVQGMVRNLPDGRVEMVAEGERDEVERFLRAVDQRMQGFITAAALVWTDAGGGYCGFTIGR